MSISVDRGGVREIEQEMVKECSRIVANILKNGLRKSGAEN